MRRVVIVGGTRTPFVKAGTLYAELDVLDLAIETIAPRERARKWRLRRILSA